MDSTLRLGAALYNADHGHLADEIKRLEIAGLDFVHLDVYDGHFVSDLGFPPRTIAALRPLSKLPFEIHLGAVDPARFFTALTQAGADLIICHIECMAMVYENICKIRDQKVRVGLAFSLGTSLDLLKPLISLVDTVLLLSRATGEGNLGAAFNPAVLPRVNTVRDTAQRSNKTLDIQVAGGIKREHIAQLVRAGVTSLALGGGLYRVSDMAREVRDIRNLQKDSSR
jgi:ribulose-phosphate 3-epimerase